LKNKNLLILSHDYHSFTKDQIETLSSEFRKVFVLVRCNPLAEISNFLPIQSFKPFRKSYRIDSTNLPSNIKVISLPILYLPIDSSYRRLGHKHFKAAENAIDVNEIHFDLVHSHFTWSAGFVGACLKEKYGVPFFVTAHGYDIYDLPFRNNYWNEKISFVLNSADHIITVSNNNRGYIDKLKCHTPVSVIPNGFKTELFKPLDTWICRKKLNLPNDKYIILSIGNLVPVKGQTYLIQAIANIKNRKKDVLCIIIGSGQLKKTLEKQINGLGLNDNVTIIEGMPHHDIPVWINACDLFVLPSISEGNPTVMFECLSCGKPFIGTKVGGIPDIINSDNLGFLSESRNPSDLSEKIINAMSLNWNRNEIVSYSKQFSWDNITDKLIEIYNKYL